MNEIKPLNEGTKAQNNELFLKLLDVYKLGVSVSAMELAIVEIKALRKK